MTELSSSLLSELRQQRITGLDLGENMIHPAYQGASLLNLPASICSWLGVPPPGDSKWQPPALRQELSEAAASLGSRPFPRVIVILVDGLGWHSFNRWREEYPGLVWNSLIERGFLAPLTSIFPSTTSAALASFWSARSPAEHGIVGYELWLKEYGLVANMIRHSPMSFEGGTGSLAQAGFNPETFLPFPTLGTHLAQNGLTTHIFQHAGILRSGLSQMLFKDTQLHPFHTASDLWINLRQMLESRTGESFLAYVYWPDVDHLSHLYGPADERVRADFYLFSEAFQKLFLPIARQPEGKDTLLVVTADHGLVDTPYNPFYDLRSHPNLTRRLHILPTGENRVMYLYPRSGQAAAVREYIERTWPGQFSFLDAAYAVESGLFGPGRQHPALQDRTGDLICYAKGSSYLWWADSDVRLLGRHGGLTEAEMLVPFLAFRLDG
jgi:hypothetical protein